MVGRNRALVSVSKLQKATNLVYVIRFIEFPKHGLEKCFAADFRLIVVKQAIPKLFDRHDEAPFDMPGIRDLRPGQFQAE